MKPADRPADELVNWVRSLRPDETAASATRRLTGCEVVQVFRQQVQAAREAYRTATVQLCEGTLAMPEEIGPYEQQDVLGDALDMLDAYLGSGLTGTYDQDPRLQAVARVFADRGSW